jgi:hypothetical protein
MNKPTRRAVLLGGAAIAGGAVAGGGGVAALGSGDSGSASTHRQYVWALNPDGLEVPSDTWVKMPWPKIALNTAPIHLDSDRCTWVFPVAKTAGIWAILCNIAWDNARSPTGAAIRPVTHRKLARIPQQNVGSPQIGQPVNLGASTDLTYHADLALLRDQEVLADGSKGYQQQQVYIQTGVAPDLPDQRTWIEVYQNSGQPLMCRWDGSSVSQRADNAAIVGLQAPSLMIGKLCDF